MNVHSLRKHREKAEPEITRKVSRVGCIFFCQLRCGGNCKFEDRSVTCLPGNESSCRIRLTELWADWSQVLFSAKYLVKWWCWCQFSSEIKAIEGEPFRFPECLTSHQLHFACLVVLWSLHGSCLLMSYGHNHTVHFFYFCKLKPVINLHNS